MKKADALITYGCSRMAYVAMRSLAGLGLKVAAADRSLVGMSQWSRLCVKSYRYSHVTEQTERFLKDILEILSDCGARFMLPAIHDTELLARHRRMLPGGVVLPVCDYEKIHMANDKAQMAEFAKGLGIPVPETLTWRTWPDLSAALGRTDFELVVKKRTGHSSNGVFFPTGADDAFRLCRALAWAEPEGQDGPPMVQRRVFGEGWGVSCLYHEGRRLASFTHRRLRESKATGGPSTLRVAASNPLLESYAEALLDSMGWHGLAMVEFKYEPETGRAWFMEVNPRLWGSINLAAASGVDFVAMLYLANVKGPETALGLARPQKNGTVSRWWLGDALNAAAEVRRMRFLKALRLVMPGGTDVYDDIRPDDPGATIGQLAGYMMRLPRMVRAKVRAGRREAVARQGLAGRGTGV